MNHTTAQLAIDLPLGVCWACPSRLLARGLQGPVGRVSVLLVLAPPACRALSHSHRPPFVRARARTRLFGDPRSTGPHHLHNTDPAPAPAPAPNNNNNNNNPTQVLQAQKFKPAFTLMVADGAEVDRVVSGVGGGAGPTRCALPARPSTLCE